jgi:hypothetical protein
MSFMIGRMDSFANALSRFTSTIKTGNVPLESRGGRFINWLKGNEAPLEGKIPMPKGDPRRLPDGSILPMPTSDPRNQIPDFADGVPLPIQILGACTTESEFPFPMPDESWSPPPVDRGAQASARADVEVKPSSDLGINVVEPSSYFTTLVVKMEKSSPDAGPAPPGNQ